MRLLGGAAAAGVAFLAWLLIVWPPPMWWRTHWPRQTAFQDMRATQLTARNDTTPPHYTPVEFETMSRWLKEAATVAEDDAFYQHGGIDWRAIRSALGYRRPAFDARDARDRTELRRVLSTAWERRDQLRGASTITQQLAKNLYLSPSRNPLRKVKEAAIAWRLEHALSKDRILALYLNVAEFGPNLWGVEAASRRYFRRAASDLTIDQAALLVATLPHPLTSNPAYRPGRTRFRAQLILRRLRGEPVVVPREADEEQALPSPSGAAGVPADSMPPADTVPVMLVPDTPVTPPVTKRPKPDQPDTQP